MPAETNVDRPSPRSAAAASRVTPERAGLAEEPDPARRGHHRRERGVEPHLLIRVRDAQRVRPDHAHPVGPGLLGEPTLGAHAVRPGVGEPRADHDERLDALGQAGVHDLAHPGRRHGDHREVDVVGDVGDGRVGPHPAHRPGLGVDRVDGAGEVAAQQVQQHGVADLRGVGGGADHGHRARVQHVVHAAGLGALLAGVADLHRALGRVDVELQMQHAVGELAADLVAGVAEHPHHLVVLGQDLGLEAPHAALPGRSREVLEQDRAEPAALVVVADDEGHLRRADHLLPVGPERALVAADGDDLAAEQDDERHPRVVVDDGEPLQVTRGDVRVRPEVAQVAGALGEPGVEVHDRVGVAGQHRAQVHHPAVGGHDVGLPVPGVGRLRRGGRLRCERLVHRRAPPAQSRGSCGSRPCSGNTARRVSSTAASTRSAPSVQGSWATSTPSDMSVGRGRPVRRAA